MFDTVKVDCLECGKAIGFQSKGGSCELAEYTLENAPEDVMSDVNRHSPMKCDGCGRYYCILPGWTVRAKVYEVYV